MNCFRPLIRHIPSARTADVETRPTSEPACGSVMATEPLISPAARRGTYCRFNSSGAKRKSIMAGLRKKAYWTIVLAQPREIISRAMEDTVNGKLSPP